ncbi:MAG: lamin tail domain-containing protein [Chitinophagaceae bacterium]
MKPYLLLALLACTHLCTAQNRYDIVISEIMADPAPPVGLPNNEWIELTNTATLPIDLQGWRIGDAAGQSGPMPAFILPPGGYVIVCANSAATALSAFGPAISVTSFPSLDNEADQLYVKAAGGMTVHAVNYTSGWYRNELKQQGGWTLEMIDTHNPCGGSNNWRAGNNPAGGTPGSVNSVNGVNTDQAAPQLNRAYTIDPETIVLVFDEPVDSASGATVSGYDIDGGITLVAATTRPPLFNEVQLKTGSPLAEAIVYTITASGIKDCKGNSIGVRNQVKTGLPKDPAAGDLVINEILFNPRPNGFDYVEIYNNSSHIADASHLYIANRNSSGTISSMSLLSASPFYMFPGDHIVVTEDADNLAINYLVEQPAAVLTLSPLPSFPDDKGTVLLLNAQGAPVDEVAYLDDWHFALLTDAEGVSLERIDPDAASQDAGNWHSAASTAGYGTPTYKNSQYRNPGEVAASIGISPGVFSPDGDGFDDIATIRYRMDEPGYVANITLFDATGRPVKSLVRNGTLSSTGYWNWDGLDNRGRKLPVGTYIILTEVFNLQGKKKTFRNTIVLARKLN